MSQPLSGTQKAGFMLLLVFGVVTVGMGFLQMRNTIYGPFVLRAGSGEAVRSFEDETTRLQRTDTDQDGLNDYEELEFYQTSPYLPDTDSDGLTDKRELDNDSDPLCPEGQACSGSVSDVAVETETPIQPPTEDVFGALTGAAPLEGTGQVQPTTDMQQLLNNPTALRDLLRKTGKFTEEQLGNIPDATLLRFATEAVQEEINDQVTQ